MKTRDEKIAELIEKAKEVGLVLSLIPAPQGAESDMAELHRVVTLPSRSSVLACNMNDGTILIRVRPEDEERFDALTKADISDSQLATFAAALRDMTYPTILLDSCAGMITPIPGPPAHRDKRGSAQWKSEVGRHNRGRKC